MTYDRGDAVGLMLKNKKGSPGSHSPAEATRTVGSSASDWIEHGQDMPLKERHDRGWRGQRDQALRGQNSSGGNEEALKVEK